MWVSYSLINGDYDYILFQNQLNLLSLTLLLDHCTEAYFFKACLTKLKIGDSPCVISELRIIFFKFVHSGHIINYMFKEETQTSVVPQAL